MLSLSGIDKIIKKLLKGKKALVKGKNMFSVEENNRLCLLPFCVIIIIS